MEQVNKKNVTKIIHFRYESKNIVNSLFIENNKKFNSKIMLPVRDPCGGATVHIFIDYEKDCILSSISIANKTDVFSRKIGNEIAKQRLEWAKIQFNKKQKTSVPYTLWMNSEDFSKPIKELRYNEIINTIINLLNEQVPSMKNMVENSSFNTNYLLNFINKNYQNIHYSADNSLSS